MRLHTLDASALYRFLTNGPGAAVVERILLESRKQGTTVRISAVNWAETLHALAGRMRLAEAHLLLDRVAGLLNVVVVGRAEAEEAAMFKMRTALSLGDCFAAVTAGSAGVLVTADADFERVQGLRVLALPKHRQ
jgi:predicted nucleic acid-binding protein